MVGAGYDAPPEYGPYKTFYNRFVRWSKNGVFKNIFEELAKLSVAEADMLMIDATHLKAHRTASSLKKRGSKPRLIRAYHSQYLWGYE